MKHFINIGLAVFSGLWAIAIGVRAAVKDDAAPQLFLAFMLLVIATAINAALGVMP